MNKPVRSSCRAVGAGGDRRFARDVRLCPDVCYATTTTTTPAPEKVETGRWRNSEVTTYLPVSGASVTARPGRDDSGFDIGASGATDPVRLLRQLTPFAGNGNVSTEANKRRRR